MTHWQLFWRDRLLHRQAELTDFTSFKAEIVLNDGGKWSMELPGDSPNASLVAIDIGSGVILQRDQEDGSGPQVVMSGPAETTRYTESADGPRLVIEGIDDTGVLGYRHCQPSSVALDAAEVDTFTGGAEAAMRYFVDQNAVYPTTYRGIPFMILGAWSNLGRTVTRSARFDNLLGLLQGIGIESGLRFQVRQGLVSLGPWASIGDAQIEFVVNAPADKASLVRFSAALGNVKSIEMAHTRPTANLIIVAGEGQGTERLFATDLDLESAQQFGLREYYYDLRQSIGLPEMNGKAAEQMAKLAESYTFAVEPLDGGPFEFVRDWNLGDRVSVQTNDQTVIGYISTVSIDLSADGPIVTPQISSLFEATRDNHNEIDLVRRIGHLERTAEMFTPSQIVGIGTPVFAPIEHDDFHDDRFALIDHDSAHDDRFALIDHDSAHNDAFAPIQHDNANHNPDMALATHNHDLSYAVLGHTHPQYSRCLTGTYTGDGTSAAGGRQITTGWLADIVFIFGGTSDATIEQYVLWGAASASKSDNGGNIGFTAAAHLHASNGFQVGDAAATGANTNLKAYTWVAFGRTNP